jgi:hypothetical protein
VSDAKVQGVVQFFDSPCLLCQPGSAAEVGALQLVTYCYKLIHFLLELDYSLLCCRTALPEGGGLPLFSLWFVKFCQKWRLSWKCRLSERTY